MSEIMARIEKAQTNKTPTDPPNEAIPIIKNLARALRNTEDVLILECRYIYGRKQSETPLREAEILWGKKEVAMLTYNTSGRWP